MQRYAIAKSRRNKDTLQSVPHHSQCVKRYKKHKPMTFPGCPLFDLQPDGTINDLSDSQKDWLLRIGVESSQSDWLITSQFLNRYDDAPATYRQYRGELQCFLNYLWCLGKRSLSNVDNEVIKRYYKFIKNPPAAWTASAVYRAFIDTDGERKPNAQWRPFHQPDKTGRYRASQSRINAARTTLTAFFRYLNAQDYISKDPMVDVSRRDKRAKTVAREDTEPTYRRFTDAQWQCLFQTLEQAADESPRYERHLFVVVTMKTLFLRVSELAPRQIDGEEDRVPQFSDFRKHDVEGQICWVYNILGKGDKHRAVTLPDAYLPYLERWRRHLGKETPLPSPRETDPILPSQKGDGLSKRQIQRTYEQAIGVVIKALQDEGRSDQALAFEAVKTETHYLRHTGASQAIEAGGDIRHISEELGHASPAITEAVYVRSDKNRMRLAGKRRSI